MHVYVRKPAAALVPVALSIAALLSTAAGCAKSDNDDESRPSASIAATPTATPSATAAATASATPSLTAEPSDIPFTPGVEVLADKVVVRMELANLRPTSMPQPVVKLDKGQTFELVVRSDKPYEIHVHGFDESWEGGVGEKTFLLTADLTGSWLLELHDTDRELFTLQIS